MTLWPHDYGRVVLNEVGSTLDEAVRIASEQPAPFWVMAHHQTGGRGRRGRAWEMPAGNFAATLVLRPTDGPAVSALRSFVMSLALWRAFVETTGRTGDFALKWPNDVLLRGGKVAGILLESSGQGDRQGLLSIGVGVNLAAAPAMQDVEDGALRPVSIAGETGVRVAPQDFLDVLARHYAELEQQFQDYGFAPVRSAWLAQAARLGEVITARTMRDEITGTFEDVDVEGHLVIRGPQGSRRIAAADVYF